MQFNDAITSAFRGQGKNRLRTALTMLGIIIGTASVIGIMSIGASAQKYIVDQVESFGTNIMNIQPGAPIMGGAPSAVAGIVVKTLVKRDADALQREPSILAVSPNVTGDTRIVYENKSKSILYVATSHDITDITNLELASGRMYTNADEDAFNHVVVLGAKLASDLFGDVNPIGKMVRFKDVSFRVIGVLKSKGAGMMSMDEYAVIPLSVGQKQLRGIDYYSEINMKIDPAYDPEFVKARITSIMRQNHQITDPSKDDFMITSMDEALGILGNVTSVITLFLAAIAAISLLVGGIGIMNIMLVSVVERTREIGLRKALGATQADIMRQFLVEAVILTSIGGIIGILAGAALTGLAYVGVNYFAGIQWPYQFPLSAVALAVGVSVGTGLVFGVYPARQAARRDPIEALRYE